MRPIAAVVVVQRELHPPVEWELVCHRHHLLSVVGHTNLLPAGGEGLPLRLPSVSSSSVLIRR
jgi:hypothetical protein